MKYAETSELSETFKSSDFKLDKSPAEEETKDSL